METMREVVEAKIASKLNKGYSNVQLATQRLMAERKIAKDFVFEVGSEKKGIEQRIKFMPNDVGGIGSLFSLPDGPERYNIHMNALRQVAAKLNIPSQYLVTLLQGDTWQKRLGYEILNTHNGWTDRNKILVRAVGDEVRAILSDQYRRLDSEMIFGTHIDAIYEKGGQLSDGYMSDTRVLLESLLPQAIEIKTELNGTIFIAFGTRLVSSDYGAGALDLRSFIMQGACLNGMVRESILREIHLGSKLPDNLALSEETYRLDSLTTSSAIRDLTANLYSSDVIKDRMMEVKAATEMRVDAGRMLLDLKGLNKLMKGEVDDIGKILMQNNPNDGVQGESTLWKITQGITAYANGEDVSQERRIDLQEIAGELFNKLRN
jgi:hypothetical protein